MKPYNDTDGKKEQVRAMFDGIARRYDLLNHLLSLGVDRGWRRRVVRAVRAERPRSVLDMATGTADLAIMLAKSDHFNEIREEASASICRNGCWP